MPAKLPDRQKRVAVSFEDPKEDDYVEWIFFYYSQKQSYFHANWSTPIPRARNLGWNAPDLFWMFSFNIG